MLVKNKKGILGKSRNFEYVTTNFSKSVIRNDTLEGKNQIVAPMIMITEGVHNGSDGPIFYPSEELNKSLPTWNHRPVVVYHPEVNGQGVSACDPIQLNSRKVGITLSTKFDEETKKVHAEAWIDPERAKSVDNRVNESIQNQKIMELSTGFYMDLEKTEGEWNGEKYVGIARNLSLDHLALLPDMKGACSIEDGAGFLRTNAEMGYETTRRLLQSKLSDKYQDKSGWTDAWIEEVYDNFFIYEKDGDYFKQTYSNSDGEVELSGEPDKVIKVVEWRKAEDGAFVGNENKKGNIMDKKKIVDSLIANTKSGWKEEDREGLMAMSEERLTKLSENAEKKEEPKKKEPPIDNKQKEPEKKKEEVIENKETKPETMEEYIAKAPAGIREVLNASVESLKQQKQRCVDIITANENCDFTPEFLMTKGLNELQGMAKLAAVKKETVDNNEAIPMFFGQEPIISNSNSGKVPEPLPLPVLNFGKEKVA